jgi:hypothetical protein
MKSKAALVFTFICFSLFTPLSLEVPPDGGAFPFIISLDVCHAGAAPALSANAVAPAIHESFCMDFYLPVSRSGETLSPLQAPFRAMVPETPPPEVIV